MQNPKLRSLLLALSLGAVTAAGAQTYGPATGDAMPPGDTMSQPLNAPLVAPAPVDTSADVPAIVPIPDTSTVIFLAPAVPPTGIDSRADSKCRSVAVNDYWDCVNSSNAGQ